MVVNNNYFNNIKPVQGNQATPMQQKPAAVQDGFSNILQDKINKGQELKFSKHAESRLQTRNIQLSQTQKDKISQAVSKAEGKGVKDSLVLMDNLAFVVNVKNKTVITAVSSNELKDNVFTNIDGAVFA
jgi:flagellar operon protein